MFKDAKYLFISTKYILYGLPETLHSYLKYELSQYSLTEIQGSVNDHGAELDEQHHQEGLWDLVVRQRGGDVCCSAVFLGRRFSDQCIQSLCSDGVVYARFLYAP